MAVGGFQACDAFVAAREGGLSLDQADAGNWWTPREGAPPILIGTNRGISAPVLAQWLGGAVTIGEMSRLSAADAARIRHDRYWVPAGCEQIPAGLDLMLYDDAVNRGVSSAVLMLQHCAAVKLDAVVGPITLAAIGNWTPAQFTCKMLVVQAGRYYDDSRFDAFGKGWLARLGARLMAAVEMLK